jgi:mandelate racemase
MSDAASIMTCDRLEYVDWSDAFAREPVKLRNGCWPISDRPGTGFEWDADAVERLRIA